MERRPRGRPKATGPKAKKFTTSMYPSDITDLGALAARWGISRPEVMRALVRHALYGEPLPEETADADSELLAA